MINLNSYNKIDILYRNYVKQFSLAYIKGSPIYVGKSLKSCININKNLAIQKLIKTYKNNFIELYMNNNKIHDELIAENICIICLEPLNENIMDVCHKCNVKCHIQCLYDWYRKQKAEVCPICLESEDYYLNVLKNNSNTNIPNNSIIPNNSNVNNIDYINETRSYTVARNNLVSDNIDNNNNNNNNNLSDIQRINREILLHNNNEPFRFCCWVLCAGFCLSMIILSMI